MGGYHTPLPASPSFEFSRVVSFLNAMFRSSVEI